MDNTTNDKQRQTIYTKDNEGRAGGEQVGNTAVTNQEQ